MKIHPTAIISPDAKIGSNVEIGAYTVIDGKTVIGDNCFIDAHVKICDYTTLGAGCRVYFGAFIGGEPQDHRFRPGIVSSTEIGEGTIIREYVTIHRSPTEGMKTVIGKNCLLMGFVHIGHDVQISDHVTIANQTAVSGHVTIGYGTVLSGYLLIHQFARIGKLSMLAPRVNVLQDVPPYCLMDEHGHIAGPNTIGLRRAGMDPASRTAIRNAIKTYFYYGYSAKTALAEIAKGKATPEVTEFVEFIKGSKRGIISGNPDMLHRRESPKADPEQAIE